MRLDPETERCLDDVIRERWKQQQKPSTITEQPGDHPDNVLHTLPPGASKRQPN